MNEKTIDPRGPDIKPILTISPQDREARIRFGYLRTATYDIEQMIHPFMVNERLADDPSTPLINACNALNKAIGELEYIYKKQLKRISDDNA